jgi:hypothetical protein
MKPIFKFIIIAFFIFGIFTAFGIWQEFERKKERKNLADQSIPVIVSDWDFNKFLGYSDSNAALGTFTEGGIESLQLSSSHDAALKFFEKKNSTYGKMKTYSGAECADFKDSCEAIVVFERGSAKIVIKVRDNKILAFLVIDTALYKNRINNF